MQVEQNSDFLIVRVSKVNFLHFLDLLLTTLLDPCKIHLKFYRSEIHFHIVNHRRKRSSIVSLRIVGNIAISQVRQRVRVLYICCCPLIGRGDRRRCIGGYSNRSVDRNVICVSASQCTVRFLTGMSFCSRFNREFCIVLVILSFGGIYDMRFVTSVKILGPRFPDRSKNTLVV
jgi:hypothetical protein